jgi:hypothetical protein
MLCLAKEMQPGPAKLLRTAREKVSKADDVHLAAFRALEQARQEAQRRRERVEDLESQLAP